MAMGEFDLIKEYFQQQILVDDFVQLSIGDDCALVSIPENYQLAITTDTMVENTHFLPSISPEDLAYKAVATNLSDLAAMGALPKWVSLALTLPNVDENWLSTFSQSLLHRLKQYNVTLGDSAAGLTQILSGKSAVNSDDVFLQQRHLRPTPRIELGRVLIDIAHAAIDLSDGLISDLGHILERSQCSAEVELSALPLSSSILNKYDRVQAEQFALTGGEDYELCFTIPTESKDELELRLKKLNVSCTCIGKITEKCGDFSPRFLRDGKPVNITFSSGFDHFKESK